MVFLIAVYVSLVSDFFRSFSFISASFSRMLRYVLMFSSVQVSLRVIFQVMLGENPHFVMVNGWFSSSLREARQSPADLEVIPRMGVISFDFR